MANVQISGILEDRKKMAIADKYRIMDVDNDRKILAGSEVDRKKSGIINRKINTRKLAPS